MKLWEGRLSGEIDEKVNIINSSIKVDCKMYKEDITASIAHAKMLGKCNIIKKEEAEKIVLGLEEILLKLENGEMQIDEEAEDIHTFVELALTNLIGQDGKRLHTARSRNDQVATDTRLYLSKEIDKLTEKLKTLCETLTETSKDHLNTVMPGYTHLQRAQPVSLAHYLMAYFWMFLRDIERLKECKKRTLTLPLGSGALAGSTYNIDREYTKELLGFQGIFQNSMDAVSDRDFALELASDISIIMIHLSRFAEEIILFSSGEFAFVSLSDEFSTGSSIMPQKKNPDVAELIRGKSASAIGNMTMLFTLMKALPLSYNKDMQEDKENLFNTIGTASLCLGLASSMIKTATFNKEKMRNASLKGFINATDCADYLTKKGIPFRDSYKITGEIVNYAIANDKTLEDLTIEEYKKFSSDFEEEIFEAIKIENCLGKRDTFGGTSPKAVKKQIENANEALAKI